MKLGEGTHYMQRSDQASLVAFRAKQYFGFPLCGVPSDSNEEYARGNQLSKRQATKGTLLDASVDDLL